MSDSHGPAGACLDYRRLFEALPGAYLVLAARSPRYEIVAVSDAYLAATMTERGAILGRGLFEVFPENSADPSGGTNNLRASLERVIALGATDVMAIQKYDIRRPPSEGAAFEERYWFPSNSPVRSADGAVAFIVHRVEDVTELVQIRQQGIERMQEGAALRTRVDREETLRQSQRLEAMGQLAGGVAHDFNNVLTAILLSCDHILDSRSLPAPVAQAATEIRVASLHAAALTRQLLAFSRTQVLQPRPVSLNAVIGQLQGMLQRVLPDDIALAVKMQPELGNTVIDTGQVEQVLLNLVVNARDAMPKGGTIEIETGNATLDAAESAGLLRAEPGPYVMLAVRDTGVGMSAATQARIFEPFFTTKERGQGTGLGLATAYGVVSQNKGTIWVYSELRRGTEFRIYLPRSEASLAPADMDPAEIPVAAGPASIMVVEDQAGLRELITATLRTNGYVAHSAGSGKDALRQMESGLVAVDLLITDVVMPDMGGVALAERWLARWPDGRVLFLSGYTEAVLRTNPSRGELHFLEKPFSAADLLAKVRRTLA